MTAGVFLPSSIGADNVCTLPHRLNHHDLHNQRTEINYICSCMSLRLRAWLPSNRRQCDSVLLLSGLSLAGNKALYYAIKRGECLCRRFPLWLQ